jgi:hypothetical protein
VSRSGTAHHRCCNNHNSKFILHSSTFKMKYVVNEYILGLSPSEVLYLIFRMCDLDAKENILR